MAGVWLDDIYMSWPDVVSISSWLHQVLHSLQVPQYTGEFVERHICGDRSQSTCAHARSASTPYDLLPHHQSSLSSTRHFQIQIVRVLTMSDIGSSVANKNDTEAIYSFLQPATYIALVETGRYPCSFEHQANWPRLERLRLTHCNSSFEYINQESISQWSWICLSEFHVQVAGSVSTSTIQ